jgi:uncharacterized membrane protein YdbT with pleckstrin-like domain
MVVCLRFWVSMVVGVLIVALLIYAAKTVLSFLDRKLRRYEIFTNQVVYHNGFLTTEYSVIPIQNIANLARTQNVIQRLLGTETMIISVQGSNSHFDFSYLSANSNLLACVDAQRTRFKTQTQKTTSSRLRGAVVSEKKVDTDALSLDDVVGDDLETASPVERRVYVMHRPRLIVAFILQNLILIFFALLFLFIVPVASLFVVFSIVGSIFQLGKSLKTTYIISDQGVRKNVDFFNKEAIEFTYDKIMVIERTRSILDSIFGTHSIRLKSIGSQVPLVMSHISSDFDVETSLFEKMSIPLLVKEKSVPLTVMQSIWASLPFFSVMCILTFGILAVTLTFYAEIVAFFVYLPILLLLGSILCIGAGLLGVLATYLRYRHAMLFFSSSHLTYAMGFLRKKRVTTKFENVKLCMHSKNNVVNFEQVFLSIAGEELIGDKNRNQSVVSNMIRMYAPKSVFVHSIPEFGLVDDELLRVKPSLRKPLFYTIVTGIFIVPLFVSIPYLLWLKTHTYVIHSNKIVFVRGFIATRTSTLQMVKVDYIELSQGAIDRLCGVKAISIYTPGTSSVDMRLGYFVSTDGESVYNLIKEHYSKDSSVRRNSR